MTRFVPIRSQLLAGERPVESMVKVILRDLLDPADRKGDKKLAWEILGYDLRQEKVVVLGGGTGLSTVVGGNSLLPEWSRRPFVGLKEEFPLLEVAVVTTDDGGSTGLLLQRLPMIGIGDLRKSCLSLIRGENLLRRYRLQERQVRPLIELIQAVFNHRFSLKELSSSARRDPLQAVAADWAVCPLALKDQLRSLAAYFSKVGPGRRLELSEHCLGNLILTAAIFEAAGGDLARPPGLKAVRRGIDRVSDLLGVSRGILHPATVTPGQLKFRYANGVEVYGQRKALLAVRGSPVEKVTAEFISPPAVSASLLRAIEEADVIIFAPGSLYSSMIPLLQIPSILEAVRENRSALKILAAAFWRQEGETDLSLRPGGRGFSVSELIEAYARNLPGGIKGLFNVVLSADLEHIPAHILRNYALEGKLPIYLDRARVGALGVKPVEAVLFPLVQLDLLPVIQHDPENFALAVRTLCYWRRFLASAPRRSRSLSQPRPASSPASGFIPSRRFAAVEKIILTKEFNPPRLKEVLLGLAWENRDILPAHFRLFQGARVVPSRRWERGREWDIIMGYFDPLDFFLKTHEKLLRQDRRLRHDLLIALGESLLGRYVEKSGWTREPEMEMIGARCYRIRLLPPEDRVSWLPPDRLERYLALARFIPDSTDPLTWRLTVNNDEGFIPPGLLFGLLYAWYLNNSYSRIIEYEMSLLSWPTSSLLPYQVKERTRKQELVKFFRVEVFSHPE